MNIVEAVAGVLKTNPYILRVEVGGHASSEGSDTYNLDLSKRRMVEVVRLLTDRGVEKERMKPVGYGESKPITTNDTEEGRAQNRRVEFNILQKEGDQ
jgi:OOP family OmpA-OmpF porin